jgi:hypothetical protein
MTYVLLIRQIHTSIFGTTMYFEYTTVLTIIVLYVSSCAPDILKYASNLKHTIVKLQAIHTTIKYTTRYSQLGKTTGPENHKTKVW